MAYQEETVRLTTWLRMEVVQVHAAAGAPAVQVHADSLGRAETDFQGEVIIWVQAILVEGVAALEERGFQDHTRTEGEETEETVPARASQVSSLFTVAEVAVLLLL